MSIKSFVTAAKSAENRAALNEALPIEVEIDDRKITFFPPDDGQFAIALAGTGDLVDNATMASTQINFFFSLIHDEKDHAHLRRRLFDWRDPFGVENVADVIEYLMEEWSARPTKQPSDFLPSQSSAGKKSTAVRHRSTSSR
jgi:hypothetical protein